MKLWTIHVYCLSFGKAALGKSSLFSNRNESIGQRVKRLERSIDAVAEDLKNAVMCIEGAMQARDERIKSELKGNIQDTETRMKEQMKSKFVALGNELKKTADKLQKGFDSSLNDDRQLSEARFELLEFLCRSIASYPTLDTSLTECKNHHPRASRSLILYRHVRTSLAVFGQHRQYSSAN